MDVDLPFHFWTLNERYRGFDEDLSSFDCGPEVEESVSAENHPLRLHRLKLNRREDSSIFVPGRAFIPKRNAATIRQRVHRPEALLPPVPEDK